MTRMTRIFTDKYLDRIECIISPQRHKGHKVKEVPKVLKVLKVANVKVSSDFSSLITLVHFSHLDAIKQTPPFREKPVPGPLNPGIYSCAPISQKD